MVKVKTRETKKKAEMSNYYINLGDEHKPIKKKNMRTSFSMSTPTRVVCKYYDINNYPTCLT